MGFSFCSYILAYDVGGKVVRDWTRKFALFFAGGSKERKAEQQSSPPGCIFRSDARLIYDFNNADTEVIVYNNNFSASYNLTIDQ